GFSNGANSPSHAGSPPSRRRPRLVPGASLGPVWTHSLGDLQRGKTSGSNPRLPSRDP
ncbi:unnamed protein product, partial [Gulo gulo]